MQKSRHAASSSLSLVRRALVVLGLLACLPAWAESSDTLSKIRQTQTVTIGYRQAARPFSFADEQKQAAGYSVELCQKVVERLRKELKLPNLKAQYVAVTGAERMPKLADGSIDMECGSTTNTKARQAKADFSYTIFVAGMKILSRADAAVTDTAALATKTVALSKGSTSAKLFSQLRDSELRNMRVVEYATDAEALNALAAGKVAAFPQDDVLLSGMVSAMADKDKYVLSSEYLSVEPYAIMVRKGDAPLLAVVDHTLTDLYASGEINKIYDRWFNTRALQLPMSSLLREVVARPAKDTGFAKILGYSL